MMTTRRKILLGAIGALGGAIAMYCFMATREKRAARTAGPMPQAVYVWQRAWTPAVRQAVRDDGCAFSEIIALGAEVRFHQHRPVVTNVAIDFDALRASGRPVGLALRIGAYSGPFHADADATKFIVQQAGQLVRRGQAAGIEPVELQVDFDCPTSKLSGYREWVRAIQRELAGLGTPAVPVTITALPTWLDTPAMADLIVAADGYVLQVHSFERPRAGKKPTLCDPGQARRAVERAGLLGKPFRVALPTYGYVVAFSSEGRFLGLHAEGPSPNWPATANRQTVSADPAELAELVSHWTKDRPAMMTGLIWYRLPVATDCLNWPMVTLAEVIAGRTPRAKLRARVRCDGTGLADIELHNIGQADASGAKTVRVHWSHKAKLLAADALNNFTHHHTGENEVQFRFSPPAGQAMQIRPGQTVPVGWLRLDKHAEVTAHVLQTKD
ncbi:MAG: DUF3142 domain-containing protein [Phycisphaerae bacterium]|nr:DUF3142 domain-containing protein [Phycisphaerae bacterium]